MDPVDPRRAAALHSLGLADPVTPHEVTRAYRALAKRLHPDAGDREHADEARFAAVHDAYQLLLATPPPTAQPPPADPGDGALRLHAPTPPPGSWVVVGPPRIRPFTARRGGT